ncbi:MAG TPA: Hsp20/alpha crystallin family protein [Pirellulales bacterium]|jgi:HSP20 family protein|nr:Hsp20/alpha crystallin family protein [Pirellulales bacterium]
MARDAHRCNRFLCAAGTFGQAHWQPSVDAHRMEFGWVLKYELAGVLPEEVHLSISGRTISLSGLRRDVLFDQRQQAYSLEISYSQFQRVIELPEDLSQMAVAMDYRDGMLIVRLTSRR